MRRVFVPIVALSIVVSACGGSDATPATSQVTPSTAPASATAAPATTMAPPAATTAAPAPVQTVPAPELGGTEWNVTRYRQPAGGTINVWKTEVTISFSADGTVSGSAGCNDYQGTWSVSGGYDEFESGVPDPNDGQELILDSLSWTERACDDDDIMQQETEILDLLLLGERWVLIRGIFNLRNAAGEYLLEAEPV